MGFGGGRDRTTVVHPDQYQPLGYQTRHPCRERISKSRLDTLKECNRHIRARIGHYMPKNEYITLESKERTNHAELTFPMNGNPKTEKGGTHRIFQVSIKLFLSEVSKTKHVKGGHASNAPVHILLAHELVAGNEGQKQVPSQRLEASRHAIRQAADTKRNGGGTRCRHGNKPHRG